MLCFFTIDMLTTISFCMYIVPCSIGNIQCYVHIRSDSCSCMNVVLAMMVMSLLWLVVQVVHMVNILFAACHEFLAIIM